MNVAESIVTTTLLVEHLLDKIVKIERSFFSFVATDMSC